MKEEHGKFLPAGSVVLLEGATKRLMITGFCTMDSAQSDVMYDYCGCLYPEGMISSDETALFNHDQIKEIYHVGFSDEEEVAFKEKLTELINANGVVSESAPAAVLEKPAAPVAEEAPVPPIGPGLPGYVAPKKEEPKLEDIPPVGPGLPGYVAPKVEAAPAAAPAQPAAPADVTNIQFD